MMLLVVLMFVLGEYHGDRHNLLEAAGGMSLELYMTHITILHWFTYYGLLETLGLWTFLAIPVLAALWSVAVFRIVHYRIER